MKFKIFEGSRRARIDALTEFAVPRGGDQQDDPRYKLRNRIPQPTGAPPVDYPGQYARPPSGLNDGYCGSNPSFQPHPGFSIPQYTTSPPAQYARPPQQSPFQGEPVHPGSWGSPVSGQKYDPNANRNYGPPSWTQQNFVQEPTSARTSSEWSSPEQSSVHDPASNNSTSDGWPHSYHYIDPQAPPLSDDHQRSYFPRRDMSGPPYGPTPVQQIPRTFTEPTFPGEKQWAKDPNPYPRDSYDLEGDMYRTGLDAYSRENVSH